MTEAADQAACENAAGDPDFAALGGLFDRFAADLRKSIIDEVGARLATLDVSLELISDAISDAILTRITALEEGMKAIEDALWLPEETDAAD
jgi:hypothetical protein